MSTTIFTSHAQSCTNNGKRKRDDFGQTPSRQGGPDYGPSSAGDAMAGLSLRGEIHSRTMKRVRNRPVEREVHDYTLQKLFCAQSAKNNTQDATPTPPIASPPAPKPQPRSTLTNYFTSFFTSSKPHPPTAKQDIQVPSSVSVPQTPLCEDCDRPLQEREIYLSGGGTCLNCRRVVCSEGGCSVAVNDGWGGEGRVCLECALR